jgi:hypothetical protein
MKQLETGEAPEAAHSRSVSQKELAEVLRQRAAISAVLRAIAGSPHDMQPIFDTIIDSAVHLCRSEGGTCRLAEEIGFRLVASKLSPAVSAMYPPTPKVLEHGSFLGRLFGSKSPVHIPDLPTHLERNSVGEAERKAISRGVQTVLFLKAWLLSAGFSEQLIADKFMAFGQGYQSMSPAPQELYEISV